MLMIACLPACEQAPKVPCCCGKALHLPGCSACCLLCWLLGRQPPACQCCTPWLASSPCPPLPLPCPALPSPPQALQICDNEEQFYVSKVLCYDHTIAASRETIEWNEARDVWWQDVIPKQSAECATEWVDAEAPLFKVCVCAGCVW